MESRPLTTFPLVSKVASAKKAELNIETSLLSKPMVARYNASATASRSVREARMCGYCDMSGR